MIIEGKIKLEINKPHIDSNYFSTLCFESNHSYGSGEEKKEVKFDSFNDLLDEIKQHFGL